ncbi:MAG: hypothetical protein HQK83_00080 [Fibrobacteria bacterium]|nr:hypothetical protein [Fibrobacteria bacterium]
MNVISEYPFLSGLGLGLTFFVYYWFVNLSKRRDLTKQIRDLKAHLNTQMEITSKGSDVLLKEVKDLKKQNENLRVSLQIWQQKPGRGDLRMLHLYDKALHLMLERAAGFAPIWENVLKEAEEEIKATERGVKALVRKFFTPSFNKNSGTYGNITSFEENKRLISNDK